MGTDATKYANRYFWLSVKCPECCFWVKKCRRLVWRIQNLNLSYNHIPAKHRADRRRNLIKHRRFDITENRALECTLLLALLAYAGWRVVGEHLFRSRHSLPRRRLVCCSPVVRACAETMHLFHLRSVDQRSIQKYCSQRFLAVYRRFPLAHCVRFACSAHCTLEFGLLWNQNRHQMIGRRLPAKGRIFTWVVAVQRSNECTGALAATFLTSLEYLYS